MSTFLDALGTIAAGGVAAAATRLEQTMGRLVPLVLAFLARLTGLGDIGKPIQALLQQLRRPLEAALEKLVGIILKLGQRLLGPAAKSEPPSAAASATPHMSMVMRGRPVTDLKQPVIIGSERHTLFFSSQRGRGRLMMASTPTTYGEFLEHTQKTILRANPAADLTVAYQHARRIADDLDQALAQDAQAHAQQAPTVDLTGYVQGQLQRLSIYTAQLLQSMSPALMLPGAGTATPIFGGTTAAPGGFGRGMHLTFSPHRLGLGSAPNVADTPAYADLRLRRRGNSPYYVMGHLLSEKLGGTGGNWENLTPLRGPDNGEHERKVENPLKRYQGPNLLLYTVLPTYGRPVNSGLIAQLYAALDPDASQKERIIRAEQYVPRTLVCTVQEISPHTHQPVKQWALPPIENRVAQSDPFDYQVGDLELGLSINRATLIELIKAGFTPDEAATIRAAVKFSGNVFRRSQQLLDRVAELKQQYQHQQISPAVQAILGSSVPELTEARLRVVYRRGHIAFK